MVMTLWRSIEGKSYENNGMPKDLKINADGLTIGDALKMHAQQIQQNVAGYVVVAGVTAALVFLITGFIDVSNAVYLIKGKTESVDQTVQLLLQERSESFDAILQANQALMEENADLRKQATTVRK